MYGYTIEYLLTKTYTQIRRLYEYGYKFDLYRRGFTFKEVKEDKRPWEEIRKDLYTAEELKEQEEFKAKLKAKG
jgi:hypothetical protein